MILSFEFQNLAKSMRISVLNCYMRFLIRRISLFQLVNIQTEKEELLLALQMKDLIV